MAAVLLPHATSLLSPNAVTSQCLCCGKHNTMSPSLCFTLPLNLDNNGDALLYQMELGANTVKKDSEIGRCSI